MNNDIHRKMTKRWKPRKYRFRRESGTKNKEKIGFNQPCPSAFTFAMVPGGQEPETSRFCEKHISLRLPHLGLKHSGFVRADLAE